MSPSPTVRAKRRGRGTNKAKRRRNSSEVEVESDSASDVIVLEDSDGSGVHAPIPNSVRNDDKLRKSPKGRRTIWSSSSESEVETEAISTPGKKLRDKTSNEPTTDLTSKNIELAFPFDLPVFLPTVNIHDNWVFWRLCSEEIYSTYDKHVVKFEGEYLSRYLLAEIFHEKINDDEAEFDPSIFFQAVLISHLNVPFVTGKGRKRLVIECEEVITSTNCHMDASSRKRILIAEKSLVDLLTSCLKENDILIIFGDIQIEESPNIYLNSRYQHPILMAHYRHDGNFGPVSPTSQDFDDVMQPCLNSCLSHSVHHFDENEYGIKILPCISASGKDYGNGILAPEAISLRSPLRRSPKSIQGSQSEVAPCALAPDAVRASRKSSHGTIPVRTNPDKKTRFESDSDESSIFNIDISEEIRKGALDSPVEHTSSSIRPNKRETQNKLAPAPKSGPKGFQQQEPGMKNLRNLSEAYGLKECSVKLKKLKVLP